ncbi:hypothetical protein IWW48_000804 [Coemansia sp. RSA 1200]|nr:hypothetical protein IWW48_000804 [Coemansia sp. RSA 1200]
MRLSMENIIAYADDPEKGDRRNKIIKALKGNVDYITPLVLFNNLGLAGSYHTFNAAAGTPAISEGSSGGVAKGLFDDIASVVPTSLGNNLQYPMQEYEDMVEAKLAKESGESHDKAESALTAYLKWLRWRMESTDKSAWPGVKQMTGLVYIDTQNKPVPGSNVKPDGVYYFERSIPKNFKTVHIILEAKWKTMDNDIQPDVLGQIGDYALQVWTEQITRAFVPVLLLHGRMLSLVVFTRKGVMVASLGPIVFSDGYAVPYDVAETLRTLWFVLTLGATEFGHLCEIQGSFLGMSFSEPKEDGTTKIGFSDVYAGQRIAGLQSRIARPVPIIMRTSYMFRITYEGRDAILKLTWTPMTRLPEGAIYQLLESTCEEQIPNVYLSGVIERDSFGYRLEFVIIENCGETIEELAHKHRLNHGNQQVLEAIVCDAIRQTSDCIAKAYSVGVLHRDISPGNIAIKNRKAKVIDWGYAKFLDNVQLARIEEIEEAWRFNRAVVSEEEAKHDPITGTPLFMSIQVLLGTRSRGIMHDMESAFYTALYALAIYNGTMDDDEKLPLGFDFTKPRNTAAARSGCLTYDDDYLEHFGIPRCLGATSAVLNSMYRFLFYEDGKYIAARFLKDINRQRHANINFARGFMDASLLPPGIATNPPPLAQPTSVIQTQSTSVDDGAGDEGESIAMRTRKRTKRRK